MGKENIELEDVMIHLGITTVQELLSLGYETADFTQITEEPAIAECSLLRDGVLIASLAFYDIKEKISIRDLGKYPIDFALVNKKVKKSGSGKSFLGRFKR